MIILSYRFFNSDVEDFFGTAEQAQALERMQTLCENNVPFSVRYQEKRDV